jgi:hypothetical protein
VPDTPTRWQGLVIRKGPKDSEKFIGIVLEALRTIASCPTGSALLNGIDAWYAQRRAAGNPPPYAVCILPKPSNRPSPLTLIPAIKSLGIAALTIPRGSRQYQAGSVTKVASADRASDRTTGSYSAVYWDPVTAETPDGARPPFIALVHELIHAYNNLRGDSYLTGASFAAAPAPVQASIANAPAPPGGAQVGANHVDEWAVVGLHGFGAGQITENQIRQELGIAHRATYSF